MQEKESHSYPKRRRARHRIIRALGCVTAVLLLGLLGAWVLLVEIPAARLPATVAELEARGETLDMVKLAPAPLPDEQNAAILLEEAFSQLQDIEAEEREVAAARGKDPWLESLDAVYYADPTEARAMFERHGTVYREYLAKRGPAMALVESALTRPGCRWDVPYDDLFGAMRTQMTIQRHLRELSRDLAWRAFVKCLKEEPDAAVDDYVRILGLSRTLAKEPTLTPYLVRTSVQGIAIEGLERALTVTEIAPRDLRRAATALAHEAETVDLSIAMRGERAYAFQVTRAIVTGEPLDDRVATLPEEDQAAIRRRMDRRRRSYVLNRLVLACQFHILRVGERMIDAANLPPIQRREAWKNVQADYPHSSFRWPDIPKRYAASLLPLIPSLTDTQTRSVAWLRTAAVGCLLAADRAESGEILRDLRSVPEDLRTDPFTGDMLRLQQLDDAVVVYSVGPNLQDEGGERVRVEKKLVKDDIAFTIPRRPVGGAEL